MFGYIKLKIKNVSTVSIGEFVHKNKQSPDAQYPVYNGGTTNTGFYDEYNRTENQVIISARGANAGYVNRVYTKYWSGNSCYTIEITTDILNWNYLYYYLKNNELKIIGEQQKAGIPAVSKKQVEEFEITIPLLERQNEIVSKLDNLDRLCNDLSEGLPAEIEARKKQYGYYRDKLLKF